MCNSDINSTLHALDYEYSLRAAPKSTNIQNKTHPQSEARSRRYTFFSSAVVLNYIYDGFNYIIVCVITIA